METVEQARCELRALGMVEGLSYEETDRRLGGYSRITDCGRRGVAFYLVEVQEGRQYQKWGYRDTYEYAALRHKLGRRRVRELLRAGRRLRELRLIDGALCNHEITWTESLLLLRVATPEHEQAWLEKAKSSTLKDLKHAVRLAREGGPPVDPKDGRGTREIRWPLRATLGTVPHELMEQSRKKFEAELGRPVGVEEHIQSLAGLHLGMERNGEVEGWKRVDSSLYGIVLHEAAPHDGCGQHAPLLVQTDDGPIRLDCEGVDGVIAEQRHACARCDGQVVVDGEVDEGDAVIDEPTPPKMRKRVLLRDGRRCRCCGARHIMQVHHIVMRSKGGPTRIWNLITLCERCHSLIHGGYLRIEGKTQKKVRFVDREGRPLHEPDQFVGKADLLRIETPTWKAREEAPRETRRVTTLADVPLVVKGDWWRRHAGLIRCNARGGLELTPGEPAAVAERTTSEPAEPAPFDEVFAGLVGRDDLLDRLRVELEGNRKLGQPFPHALFTGPPGTGKTTLAEGLGQAAGGSFVRANGPLVQDTATLLRLLTSLEEGGVLFLDEIHRMPEHVQEVLYEGMAQGRISLTLHARGGMHERAVTLELPAFTVLAATTEPHLLPGALKSRFALQERLARADDDVLADLAKSEAAGSGLGIEDKAATLVAASARGIPREVLRLLTRIVVDAACRDAEAITADDASEVLARQGIDEEGTRDVERRYLDTIRRERGAVSVSRLASLLDEDVRTLKQEVEPWLFRKGLIRMTPHGRAPGRHLELGGEQGSPYFKPSAARRSTAAPAPKLTIVGSGR